MCLHRIFWDAFQWYFSFSFDGWEVSPTSITLGKKIGEGAFGTVYVGAIDEEKMKILKYWKQRSNGFNLEKNNCEVAVKKVKGNKILLLATTRQNF